MHDTISLPPDAFYFRHRFQSRKKLHCDREAIKVLTEQIQSLLADGETTELRTLLDQYYPPDLADVMELLDDQQNRTIFSLLDTAEAADVLDELDERHKEQLAKAIEPNRLARILEALPSDEAVDVVRHLSPTDAKVILDQMNPAEAKQVQFLLGYPEQSAGRLMSLGYVAVTPEATAAEALDQFRHTPDVESIFSIFVIDNQGALQGVVDLRQLLNAPPERAISQMMMLGSAKVSPETDREDVARIFARYDLNSLPVVDPTNNRLLGVITADDIIDVIEAESTEDILRMAGSDAEEMERRSPQRTALLRLPWIMATMFIELLAGVVIHFFDATLARVLLLTSFMPIISAISGNTGLQSATIIVRGLSTGTVQVTEWTRAITRQLVMTLILGGVAGLTLGIIGTIWYGKWTFGLVVAVGMFAAVNIAGVVGTVVPLTSKRLGFDPAITSGPFETAFQDVVGISIFLSLATAMLRFLIH